MAAPVVDALAGPEPPNIRETHPNLYRLMMCYMVMFAGLAINFALATPTFLVYGAPNYLWASCFASLAVSKLVFLHLHRSLAGIRLTIALAVAFLLFFTAGTSEPFLHGSGSLQLPILYLGLALIQFPILIEPFLNPWTARGNGNHDSV